MKKNIKNGSGKRNLFSLKSKRAYIALSVFAVLVIITVAARDRAINSIEKQKTFDDEMWKAAVAESGVGLKKIQETEKTTKLDKVENTLPVVSEAVPQKEVETVETEEENQKVEEVSTWEELIFTLPSKGSVLNDYSGDELVYSNTMEDWRTHNGIDFAADEGDQVVAAAKGQVSKVYKDDYLGITVEIQHSGGVISRYSGLQSLDFIVVGKTVNPGDIIGGIGTSGTLEQEDGHHLHFEIIKNGEFENPNLYFAK